MSLQKTEAIVLKSIKQGETSKILTLFTRTFGKMTVIAKGARSAKSKFGGSLEQLNYIAIVFYKKENRDIQLLSQADIILAFPDIKRNLEKMALAAAIGELVYRLEHGEEPNPRLFRLCLDALKAIDQSDDNCMNLLRAFQVRLMAIHGFYANFGKCLKCKDTCEGGVVFNISEGGYLCENCKSPETSGFYLSHESISALGAFQKMPFNKLNDVLPSHNSGQQVDAFIETYLRYHTEGFWQLNALKFYKKIKM